MAEDTAWHLDKKIPISIIVALTMNIVFGVWYSSKLDSRVSSLEQTRVEVVAQEQKTNDSQVTIGTRLTRVEDHVDSILEVVRRIETKADSVAAGPPKSP